MNVNDLYALMRKVRQSVDTTFPPTSAAPAAKIPTTSCSKYRKEANGNIVCESPNEVTMEQNLMAKAQQVLKAAPGVTMAQNPMAQNPMAPEAARQKAMEDILQKMNDDDRRRSEQSDAQSGSASEAPNEMGRPSGSSSASGYSSHIQNCFAKHARTSATDKNRCDLRLNMNGKDMTGLSKAMLGPDEMMSFMSDASTVTLDMDANGIGECAELFKCIVQRPPDY